MLTCIEGDAWHHRYYDSRMDAQLLKKQRKAAQGQISKLEELAGKKDVNMTSKIIRASSVVKEIVSFAKSHKIDLVVMGSHGRTGFDKLLLGSVTSGVSQKVNCPVLIVK